MSALVAYYKYNRFILWVSMLMSLASFILLCFDQTRLSLSLNLITFIFLAGHLLRGETNHYYHQISSVLKTEEMKVELSDSGVITPQDPSGKA